MDKRELKKYEGEMAIISISHKLYGEQKIKCELNWIFNEDKIGVRVKRDYEIYMYMDKIVDYGIEDGIIYFADDLMRMDIKLHRQ